MRLRCEAALVVFTLLLDDFTAFGNPYPDFLIQELGPVEVIDAQSLADKLAQTIQHIPAVSYDSFEGFLTYKLLELSAYTGKIQEGAPLLGYVGKDINLLDKDISTVQSLQQLVREYAQYCSFSYLGSQRLLRAAISQFANENYINTKEQNKGELQWN